MSQDPRPFFADVVAPILDDVLSQWTPPLKEKHFDQVQRELTDELFGREIAVVEVDDRLVVDELGDPVDCCEVKRGGKGPYQVVLTFHSSKWRDREPAMRVRRMP